MIKMGIGFDAHRLVKGRRLILGGVPIEHAMGLEGHSDADVLCHALADALLGAMADGDIGVHFPDTDPRWKDANSLDLLAQVVERLKTRRAHIVHVDATVMAEAPKLAPYQQAMRERLARVLEVSVEGVSIKATTLEGMGALGRREGIAAMAVATVEVAKRTTRQGEALRRSLADGRRQTTARRRRNTDDGRQTPVQKSGDGQQKETKNEEPVT